jgi:hypothetical protein
MRKGVSFFAAALLATLALTAHAQQPEQETAKTSTSAETAMLPPAGTKVMREYKGLKLGLKRSDVRAVMGKPELSEQGKDRFIIKGDDRLTIYYDQDAVKAIQLYIVNPQNAPVWADVVGEAEVKELESGAKHARRDVPEEGFWVSMYQSKDGSMTTVTISR